MAAKKKKTIGKGKATEPADVAKPVPKPPADWGKWFKRTRPAPNDKEGWRKWVAAVAKHQRRQ